MSISSLLILRGFSKEKTLFSCADTKHHWRLQLSQQLPPSLHLPECGSNSLALKRQFPGSVLASSVQGPLWLCVYSGLATHATSVPRSRQPALQNVTENRRLPSRPQYHDLRSCSQHLSLLIAIVQTAAAPRSSLVLLLNLARPCPSSWPGCEAMTAGG